jgi:RNA 3'-terminal phosphate cyclase-like protein
MRPIRFLRSASFEILGKIKKVRGICSGSKVNPQILNRCITSARAALNNFLPDVWITSDFQKNKEISTGYSVFLWTEPENSTFNSVFSDTCADIKDSELNPEKLGELSASKLLDEILF